MYPMLLDFPYKQEIWGGDNLCRIFKEEEYKSASEIWLLSALTEGETTVKNGELKGETVSRIAEKFGRSFAGGHFDTQAPFPLFIKVLDAKDNLPLAVCTRDRLIYIAEAEEGANMIFGFTHNLNDYEIHRRISQNALFSACNFLPVKSGDIIKIPTGYVSAVGKGIICYEIGFTDAENYILSDYGRTDLNGQRKIINIDKTLKNTYLGAAGNITKPDDTFLYPFGTVSEAGLDEVSVSLVRLAGSMGINEEQSFVSLIVLSGSAMLSYPSGSMHLKMGDSLLIPADMRVKITGYADLLCSHI